MPSAPTQQPSGMPSAPQASTTQRHALPTVGSSSGGGMPTVGRGSSPITTYPSTQSSFTPGFHKISTQTAGEKPIGSDEANRINKEAGRNIVDPNTPETDAGRAVSENERDRTDARASSNALRAANAPEEAQNRKDEREMGYAVNSDGQLVYMSRADAGKQMKDGKRSPALFEPVTAGQIEKDRQAMRQLNDVQNNVDKYRIAVKTMPHDISEDDARRMASIASGKDEGVKLSVWGLGFDTDMMNDWITSVQKSKDWNDLDAPERNIMSNYLAVMSSMMTYQRALSGIGRVPESQIKLEQANMPLPMIGATASEDQFERFQTNMDVAGQGFPTNLPGLPNLVAEHKAEENATKTSGVPTGAVGTISYGGKIYYHDKDYKNLGEKK
jgi:hypothetical protein